MKRKILVASCLLGILALCAPKSEAAIYYTTSGCRCSCPPPSTSRLTIYSPYGSFSVSDEYYFSTVTFKGPKRHIGRPTPPPPPRPLKPGKPGPGKNPPPKR